MPAAAAPPAGPPARPLLPQLHSPPLLLRRLHPPPPSLHPAPYLQLISLLPQLPVRLTARGAPPVPPGLTAAPGPAAALHLSSGRPRRCCCILRQEQLRGGLRRQRRLRGASPGSHRALTGLRAAGCPPGPRLREHPAEPGAGPGGAETGKRTRRGTSMAAAGCCCCSPLHREQAEKEAKSIPGEGCAFCFTLVC